MKRIYGILGMAAVMTLLAGCILFPEPYREMARYDFLRPEKAGAKIGAVVNVEFFGNLTPSNRKMLFRGASGEIYEDNYTAWIQSPELLLQRYLAEYFATAERQESPRSFSISGNIFQFDLDRKTNTATLGVQYEIRAFVNNRLQNTRTGTLQLTEPMPAVDGSAAATAMSHCARRLAEMLNAQIQQDNASLK